MLKRLMITTAAAALVVGSAVAQQTPPPAQKAPPPMKSEPMPQAGAAISHVVAMQGSDHWLASKFKGTDVIGANNEKIGDVNDVLFDRNGKVIAYVVGVGGFLGIGAKDVALAPAAFQVQPASDREELKLRLAMSRDDLKNAPEFKPASSRPTPTTGQSPPRERTSPPAAPAPR